MFPVDIDLIDPEFYSFYLGLIIEKKTTTTKELEKKRSLVLTMWKSHTNEEKSYGKLHIEFKLYDPFSKA